MGDALGAHHQAGHAVVGHYLGLGVPKSLTVAETDDCFGPTVWPRLRLPKNVDCEGSMLTPAQRDRVERFVMMGLAGQLAEERFSGVAPPEGAGLHQFDVPVACEEGVATHFFSLGGHAGRAQQLLEWLNTSEAATAAHMEWLIQRTLDILDNPIVWHRVVAVAKATFERETLSGAQLAELMDAATAEYLSQRSL